ncbi:MAG: phosphoribosylaminoimidazolesuccinocarboxamide synthase [Planctomycetes bacterium]|nr:phosphoribosylaminoimidazolesuccinocarboxamide synthase [Planctomycetota bacterium]
MNPVLSLDLPFAKRLGRGKVRELFELNGDLLLVASDRISAFDVVMQEGIPGKGWVLTGTSAFWFRHLAGVCDHHLLSVDVDSWADVPAAYKDVLRGRTMRCKKARPLPIEWVVRGYLTGSGWKDYQKDGMVSGVQLPAGLQHASELDPPILTPSTKAETGHDEPISFARVVEMVGREVAEQARDYALELYRRGREYARSRGIVIADTKFEFGVLDGKVVLIDECLTPDSSRFWPAHEVRPGSNPTSFDKQYLRDWLTGTGWNKNPPPPTLPPEVIQKTAATYAEIQQRLTAQKPIAFLLGSDSDLPVLEGAFAALSELGVGFHVRILSAHRTPEEAGEFARNAHKNGVRVLIGVAGMAAHLAGALAAHSTLPVLGVPVDAGPLQGHDALLSTAMMPPGIPVAAMGIGKAAARNAALLAVRILALSDPAIAGQLERSRRAERDKTLAKDAEVRRKYGC